MQVTTSSSIALQLLVNANRSVSHSPLQDLGNALDSPASRYTPKSSAIQTKLDGIYADPRLKDTAAASPKLANEFVSALQEVLSADVKEFKDQSRSRLESALGRPLGDQESFADLGSHTRSMLPKEVLEANRSVQEIEISFSAMMSRAKKIDLDSSLIAGQPKELRDLDMSKKQDRQTVVDFAIKFQVMINSSGVKMARQDDVASEMLSKSLDAAGVKNDDALYDSYTELHRSRFEAGDFSVVYGGVEITRDSL